MKIIMVPVGKIDNDVIRYLRDELSKAFNRKVSVGKPMSEPDYAFNKKRGQHLSTTILFNLMKQVEYKAYEKILGLVGCDLYVPKLNFVFGEASEGGAVISFARLKQEFYGLPADKKLFYKRALTEAVHELGHTFELSHCSNPRCVMYFSNTLADTDRKGPDFCPICKNKLSNCLL